MAELLPGTRSGYRVRAERSGRGSRPHGTGGPRRVDRVQPVLHAGLLVLIVLSLYPMLFTLITSVKDIYQFYHSYFGLTYPFHWGNYSEAWHAIGGYMTNSLIVAVSAVVITVAFAALSAYAFARFDFFGKEFLFMALLALIMIPDMITLVPTFLVLRTFGFLDSLASLVAIYVSGGQAVTIFILRQFFAGIPEELIDAARIDGASEAQVLGRVVLPLSKSILVTVALMNSLTVWNDYIWPLVTLSDTRLWTVTLGLVGFYERFAGMAAWGPLFAGYVIASIPLIVLISASMRSFVADMTSGAIKA